MKTLPLPPLAGTRRRAQGIAKALPEDLTSKTVVVDGRELIASSPSFADELINLILIQRKAEALKFINVSDLNFAKWIDERALANDVVDKVTVDRRPA